MAIEGWSSGPNLDKDSVWILDPAPFYENYKKLYFDAKLLKSDVNRGGEIWDALFFKESALYGQCYPYFPD